MGTVDVEKIAEAVLYEGYLLFPYRRSALKNQQRWTFGGVYPRGYSEATGGDDPWQMQTQCLVAGNANTQVAVKVRFLHVVQQVVEEVEANGAGTPRRVEELRVGGQVYRPWEEAREREIVPGVTPEATGLRLGDLQSASGFRFAIDIPAGRETEPLVDAEGAVVGALVREWEALQGYVEVVAEPVSGQAETEGTQPPGETVFRLTVRILNTLPWPKANENKENPDESKKEITENSLEYSANPRPAGRLAAGPLDGYFQYPDTSRPRALRHTFVSTHTILRVQDGAFLSLLEPPEGWQQAAEACTNIKTWPVLVGEPGERNTLLSSPIILYDYPQISPESQGNYFDATEIDELLALSVMTLTDDEKQEMRETDIHAREILERTEALSEEQLLKLHGAVRSLQPVSLQPVRREEA